MKILIATHNPGKISEYKTSLSGLNIEFLSLSDFAIIESAPEDFETLDENARSKARYYGELSGVCTISDDAGLFVDALDGKPGVRTNELGKDPAERIKALLLLMKGVPIDQRMASFMGTFVIYNPKTKEEIIVHGKDRGRILAKPVSVTGRNGYGYDPVYYCLEKQKTYAELSAEEKNSVSYRGKALREIRSILEKMC